VSRLRVSIDTVTVETDREEIALRDAGPRVQEAFRLLAQRLAATPFRRFGGSRELVVSLMRTEMLPLDELLGPRGAERLADELYRELIERVSR